MEFSSMLEDQGDDDHIGFEEGRIWLPAHVLDEAWEFKESLRPQQNHYRHQRYHNHRRPKIHLQADPVPLYHQYYNSYSSAKSSSKILYQSSRPMRVQGNNQALGTGMQAVFLDSGERTCGTGFFLPRKAGNTFQPNKKPACSPVLLPTRVVQALNLNVHELGSQLTPKRDSINNTRSRIQATELTSNKNGSDNDAAYDNVSTTHCVASKGRTRSSSPEIFLPKEWSY